MPHFRYWLSPALNAPVAFTDTVYSVWFQNTVLLVCGKAMPGGMALPLIGFAYLFLIPAGQRVFRLRLQRF